MKVPGNQKIFKKTHKSISRVSLLNHSRIFRAKTIMIGSSAQLIIIKRTKNMMNAWKKMRKVL